ncbi:FkbM family methyltransferase [Aquabacter spiritensis]|uniref:FkbM family methyltransferase n=1 Tax=Aquabacter spiritensis TaxID=933073 RepID=UPI001404F295|nr:FkbM family methyltransferase [Aquabacter spiritensis]
MSQDIDVYAWQNAIRRRAKAVHLGGTTMLARSLGRYLMFLDAEDVGFAPHILMDGFWESWITRFMVSRIQPGMVVADIGANFGYYTLLMADLAGPGGKVLAFEPNTKVVAALAKSVAVNGYSATVQIEQVAVSDRSGETCLFVVPPGEPKNGYLVPATARTRHPDATEVPVRKLDDYMAAHPRLDFIKIDAEGAEERIFAGMTALLERDRPEILLEFNAQRSADAALFLDLLAGYYGREFQTIDHLGNLKPVTREQLLTEQYGVDWMLFLNPKGA